MSGRGCRSCVDQQLSAGLKELSLRHGTTLFMTLLAAWAVVLSRLSGQEDVVIGAPSGEPGTVETEGLIGFFVNTLALRIDVGEDPSVGELLERVRDDAGGAGHQDLPFEQVVEIVQPPRQLNHTPLFQVMFAWQEGSVGSRSLRGVEVSGVEVAYEVAKFDLQLDLSEQTGRSSGG